MSKNSKFKPFPLITNCHTQTILGTVFTFSIPPASSRRLIELSDGDKMALEISTPNGWTEKDPTLVLVHGLCGSHRSTYLVRMTKKMLKLGYRCIRLNLRGCGSGKGEARGIYHSGCSPDVREVIEVLKEETPHSLITLIGFSLGGNIVLKLAAELCQEERMLLHKVIAVSPPIDLFSSLQLLEKEENVIYARYFLYHLQNEVDERYRLFPDIPHYEMPDPINFYLFDKHYIIPQIGFQTNEEYYEKCSSGPLIRHISIPCHILFAQDDPIIDCRTIDNYEVPENVQVTVTNHGGHMGFIGSPLEEGGFHWMDSQLIRWITQESPS